MNTPMQAIGWTLIHFVWQGTAIALVIAAALRATERRSPNVRYLIACAGLALMLAAPAVTARLMWTAPESTAISAEFSNAVFDRLKPQARSSDARATARTPIVSSPTDDSGSTPPAARAESFTSQPLDRFVQGVTIAWLAGVLLLLARMIGGWWHVRRLHRHALATPSSRWQTTCRRIAYRLGLPAAAHVVESALVDVPTVVGWLRPAIVLPIAALAALTPAQVEAILAHELAHIRRHDYLVNLLQTVAETLLFYHPAVWWMSKRIRAEREHCCDEVAVSLCGDAVGYAKALAALEAWRSRPAQLAVAATGGSLLDRVRRILRVPIADEPRSPSWAVTLALTVMFTAGAGVVQHLPWPSSHADASTEIDGAQLTAHLASAASPLARAAASGQVAIDEQRFLPPPQPPQPPEPPEPPQPPEPPDSFDADAVPSVPAVPPLAPMPPLPPVPPLPLMPEVDAVPPAPLTPPAPPVPPAPPAPQSEHSHISITNGDSQTRMSWSDGSTRLEINLNGNVTFTDDLTDVRTLSDGGRLTIREWSGLIPRTFEIRSSGGQLTRTYYVAGVERPWNDEARQRLAEQITVLVRRSGIGAESRVRSIFERKGVSGVLDEIELLGGDYARRRYFVALVETAPLDASSVLPVLLRVGSTMKSDYERSEVLRRIAAKVPLDQRAAQSYANVLSRTSSDYERRRALNALLAIRPPVPGVADIVLRSAADMRSDYERSELLRTALATGPIEQADTLFAAVGRMSSAYEKKRVLTGVIARGSLSTEMRKGVLTAAAGMQSDYERAEVLTAYVRAYGVESAVREEFFGAVKQMSSDYERRRVLTQLAGKGNVARDVQESAFNVVQTMKSDYERAEILLAFLNGNAVDGSVRQAFVNAAERIQSQHEQNRVLAALVRAERR
jgi:beta-lactamase regulating signal transducer with metallopeptidase domain